MQIFDCQKTFSYETSKKMTDKKNKINGKTKFWKYNTKITNFDMINNKNNKKNDPNWPQNLNHSYSI